MKLKLNQSQYEAIARLLGVVVNRTPSDIPGSLAKDLMQPIYNKMLRRVADRSPERKSWNLKLTDIEAKALYTFFAPMELGPGWGYEENILRKHLTEIHTIYSNPF